MNDKKAPDLGDILRAISFLMALFVFFALVVGFGMRPGKISINFGPIDVEMERPTQQANSEAPPTFPTLNSSNVSQVIEYAFLDLQPYSELSSPETNLGLPPGTNTLNGIPFQNGWKVTTQCTSTPDRPAEVTISANIPHPLEIYVLFQAGWGITPFNGMQVGAISLYFSGGDFQTENLVLGYNIGDWARNKPDAVSTISSPMVSEAWRGALPDNVVGGMDILTIPVLSNYQDETLERFVLSDTSLTTAGNLNPCVHLLAVTVKHRR